MRAPYIYLPYIKILINKIKFHYLIFACRVCFILIAKCRFVLPHTHFLIILIIFFCFKSVIKRRIQKASIIFPFFIITLKVEKMLIIPVYKAILIIVIISDPPFVYNSFISVYYFPIYIVFWLSYYIFLIKHYFSISS